jgi:hypothetical protein
MSVQNNPFGAIAPLLRFGYPAEPQLASPGEQSYSQSYSQSISPDTATLFLANQPLVEARHEAAHISFVGTAYPTAWLVLTDVSIPSLGNLTNIMSELENLDSENEVPPTNFAYLKSRAVVGMAYGLMLSKQNLFTMLAGIPEPVIVTDDVGGIRMAWRKGNKTVRANFGGDEHLQSYSYFESPTEHGVVPLDGGSLSDRLKWLSKG